MGNAYYIGNMRHRRCGKRSWGRRILFLFLLVFLTLLLVCRFSVYPYIEGALESESKKRLTALCAEKTAEIFSEGGYEYSDLIHLSYTNDGRVASATVNTVTLNLLRYKIAMAVLKELKDKTLCVHVPLSNILGLIFLPAKTGGVNFDVQTAESLHAAFSSHFEERGINQTRHLITFDLSLEIYFLLPLRYRTMTLHVSTAAAETLIIGEVPDSFTDIDRLTDGEDELYVDDAVDFGDVVA